MLMSEIIRTVLQHIYVNAQVSVAPNGYRQIKIFTPLYHIMNVVNVLGRGLANVFCNLCPIPLCFHVMNSFEVNTKCISSNVLKISVTSRLRSTSEIADIFNT